MKNKPEVIVLQSNTTERLFAFNKKDVCTLGHTHDTWIFKNVAYHNIKLELNVHADDSYMYIPKAWFTEIEVK